MVILAVMIRFLWISEMEENRKGVAKLISGHRAGLWPESDWR